MTDIPTKGRFDGKDHILPVRVYYEDTDFTGVVYHANYVRYFERGRSDFLRAAGIGHTELLQSDDPLAFVVSELSLKYVRPARIDDALIVRTRYQVVKGVRMLIQQTIERDGEVLCRADVVVACIYMDGRPRRPSKLLLQMIEPWLSGQNDAQ